MLMQRSVTNRREELGHCGGGPSIDIRRLSRVVDKVERDFWGLGDSRAAHLAAAKSLSNSPPWFDILPRKDEGRGLSRSLELLDRL
jgi:hypothetical protein